VPGKLVGDSVMPARAIPEKERTDMNRASAVIEPQRSLTEGIRRRAEAEYMEMPGLKLTAAQASRLWHLDVAASVRLLDSMVEAGVLYRARDGAYVLLSAR
jgi:hypothetical protein